MFENARPVGMIVAELSANDQVEAQGLQLIGWWWFD